MVHARATSIAPKTETPPVRRIALPTFDLVTETTDDIMPQAKGTPLLDHAPSAPPLCGFEPRPVSLALLESLCAASHRARTDISCPPGRRALLYSHGHLACALAAIACPRASWRP